MWYQALWKLALLASIEFSSCKFLIKTADPPADLQIVDPGHLGELYIKWTTPSSLQNRTDCFVRFQLQYLSTHENRWKIIRTNKRSYTANFDLEKDSHVRLQTLVSGPCINSFSEIQSPPVEAVLKAQRGGIPGSRLNGLKCVFHNWEYMECVWHEGSLQPWNSHYRLYYWHRGMEQAGECHEYIETTGERTGCRFNQQSLMEFTEFNVCVNGSVGRHLLQAAYFTLQIQNLVKPDAIKIESLESLSGGQFLLKWSPPVRKIPHQCLEFEVESRSMEHGEPMQRNITRELSLLISGPQGCMKACLRVRCRVHHLCADTSFWSEWSPPLCIPEEPGLSRDCDALALVMAVTRV